MIYIRTDYDSVCETTSIVGVYDVNCEDVEEKYKLFMLDKASEINLNVNPHWLNVLDYELHNSHLSELDFNEKCKEWKKIRRQWNIAKYITEILKGYKRQYKETSF